MILKASKFIAYLYSFFIVFIFILKTFGGVVEPLILLALVLFIGLNIAPLYYSYELVSTSKTKISQTYFFLVQIMLTSAFVGLYFYDTFIKPDLDPQAAVAYFFVPIWCILALFLSSVVHDIVKLILGFLNKNDV